MKEPKRKPPTFREPTVAELAQMAATIMATNPELQPFEATRLALKIWINCFTELREFYEPSGYEFEE